MDEAIIVTPTLGGLVLEAGQYDHVVAVECATCGAKFSHTVEAGRKAMLGAHVPWYGSGPPCFGPLTVIADGAHP